MRNSQSAFTLVELAIVLAIIGLIIGGALTGRDLIRASELNSVITDEKRYVQAVQNFREKYSALPGDMKNATAYWGIANGTTGNDATCGGTASVDSKTCNGNGDGQVQQMNLNNIYEYLRFWQHLANAGLIDGQFSGFWSGSMVPGTNIPKTRVSGVGWLVYYRGTETGDNTLFAGNFGHLMFTTMAATLGTDLTPTEAYNIDSKVDDGMPSSGQVIGFKGDATYKCTTKYNTPVGSDTGAAYNTSDTNKDCQVFFINAF